LVLYFNQDIAAINSLGLTADYVDGTLVFIAKYGSASINILHISSGIPSSLYSFLSRKLKTFIPGFNSNATITPFFSVDVPYYLAYANAYGHVLVPNAEFSIEILSNSL
jgi:hypothetical protein